MKIKTLQCLVGAVWLTAFDSAGAPLTPITERNALLPPSSGGGGDSQLPILTPDGHYVAFASTANNLVTDGAGKAFGSMGLSKVNVFLRDRIDGTTTLVSLNTAGTGGGLADSFPTAISDNGRYVLFESAAANLVPSDTNGVADVFLRDTWSNITHLVSTTTNGLAGNNLSRGSTLTPDGRYVAFTSLATNLVTGDTNAIPDIFVRDMETKVTFLATPGSRGAASYNPIGSESPDLSSDGRYLAFYSVATNVVPGVTNRGEVYVRDLVAETTTWVSSQAHSFYGPNTVSFNHALSADGNFLAYVACSNYPAYGSPRSGAVLRYNLASGLTDVVSTNAFVPMVNPEEYHDLATTADGRLITFVARNDSSPSSGSSIWRWDAQTGISQLVSSNLSGSVTTFAFCARPVMDATGRYIAYVSNAGDFVTNSLAGDFQVFLTDVDAGVTILINVGTNGMGAGVGPLTAPQISSNGALVIFDTVSADLVTNDSNYAGDIFARDWTPGTNELISVRAEALPGNTPNGPVSFDSNSASQDGQRVVFASEARNLVPLDTNGFRDVFVRDLFGSSNVLVSVNTNGGVANGTSWEPAISPDGRYVVFTSDANDLVPGDTNKVADVFLRDLDLGQTRLISVTPDGIGVGDRASDSPVVGTDGRFVLFRSQAINLVSGLSFNSSIPARLFQRDMIMGITSALTPDYGVAGSATPDGRFVAFPHPPTIRNQFYIWDGLAKQTSTNWLFASNVITSVGSNITSVFISPDARTVVCTISLSSILFFDLIAKTNTVIAPDAYFSGRAGLRFSADSRCFTYAAATNSLHILVSNRVYRYDFRNKQLNLVSHTAGSQLPASGNSDSPDISGDGRFVVYRSSATNLVATDLNSEPDVYLYDAQTGSNILLSVSLETGGYANNRSRGPVFSPDGRTLFFHTWAQDMITADFNQNGDIVSLPLLYLSVSPSQSPTSGPTLSWPNRPGETYLVQFKDNPHTALWQTLSGSITVVGNRATLTDTAPASDHRIYRVLAQ